MNYILFCAVGIGFLVCFVLMWRTMSRIQRTVRAKQPVNVKKTAWELCGGEAGLFVSLYLIDLLTWEKIGRAELAASLLDTLKTGSLLIVVTAFLLWYVVRYNRNRKNEPGDTP